MNLSVSIFLNTTVESMTLLASPARLRMSAGEAMTLLSYQKNLSELLLRLSQMDVMLDRNFWRSFAVFVRKYGDNQSP